MALTFKWKIYWIDCDEISWIIALQKLYILAKRLGYQVVFFNPQSSILQPSLFRRPLPNCPVFRPGNNGHQEPGQKNLPWLMIFFARPFALGVSANLKSFSRRIDFFFQTNFFARVHMIRAFSAALILYYFRDASMSFKEARPKVFVCLFVLETLWEGYDHSY